MEKKMKQLIVKAHHIKIGGWFMVIRTKKWYKKKRHGNTYTEGYQIQDNKKYLVPNEEPVEIRK